MSGLTPVSAIATVVNGFPFDSRDFAGEGEVPLVRIRDISSETFQTYVPAEAIPEWAYIRDGDVVIGMDGDFNAVLWSRGLAALNQRVCLIRANASAADPRFLAFALSDQLAELNALTFSTTVKHLSSKQVRSIRLHCFPLAQQQAIADYLDRETARIDSFIAKNEQLIALFTERRIATITREVQASELRKLRFFVDPARPMTYGILQAGDSVDGGIPYLGPSDLPGEGASPLRKDLRTTAPEIAAQYKRSTLAGGDVVVSIGPAYGRVGVMGEEIEGANLTQDTVRVASVDALIDRRYLVWVLCSRWSTEFWDREIQGSTFRRLNLGTLANTPIPFRPLEEQRAIASRIDAATAKIDAAIATAQHVISLARERRSAVISAAVTGAIDVV